MRVTGMVAAFLALSACASEPPAGQWTRPGDDGARYSRDAATCRSEARRRAEREFRLDTQHLDRRGDGVFGRQSIETDIARRDAERYRRALYEECLRNQGYEQRRPGNGAAYPLEAR